MTVKGPRANIRAEPRWRNWQTRCLEGAVGFKARVGSNPTLGTSAPHEGALVRGGPNRPLGGPGERGLVVGVPEKP